MPSRYFHLAFYLGLSLVVVAAIITGFYLIGSPGKERQRRLDTTRTQHLESLSYSIDYYYRSAGQKLPSQLSELTLSSSYRLQPQQLKDPGTGEPYGYRVIDQDTYELCATFVQTSADRNINQPPPTAEPNFWNHGAGRQCFSLDVRVF